MANNPYVNKVEYGGQTLIDLTNDTVTPADVAEGVLFHDRSGAQQIGIGGGGDVEFTTYAKYNGGIICKKEDFNSFEIKVNTIQSGASPLRLKVANTLPAELYNNWGTLVKTWTTTTSNYEDILSLVGDYQYFGFDTVSNGLIAIFSVKCN